jgi:hypothetical protein
MILYIEKVGLQEKYIPYRFDPLIFHGNTTEFDVNEAEKQLFAQMKLPETINGCTLVIKQSNKKESCYSKCNWTFICSHGLIIQNFKDSDFGPDSVGRLHVPIQNEKRTTSKGTVVKGKYEFLLICPILCGNSFVM